MTALAASTLLSRHPEAANSRVGDETVILHLVSGTYFGLDPVGTRIWELLEQPVTLATLTARLLSEFDVSAEVLTRDVTDFLDQMLAHEIVQAGEGGG
ncbi:MAG: PqqD family protein [Rubellimicrobium sp.]|nr:PqqD family protein [Rubellimicrobium sp.]